MGAVPSTASAGGASGNLSSDLLRRLQQRANREEYNPQIHGPEDLILFHEWAEATETNVAILNNERDSPEAVARRTLDSYWRAVSAVMDVQEMIRDAELRERLLARSQREEYDPDIHGPEDEVLAREYAEAHGIPLPICATPDAQEAACRRYLDNIQTTVLDPQAVMSSYLDSTTRAAPALNDIQTAIRSIESRSNDGIRPENLQHVHSIQNSLADIQFSNDRINRDMADIQSMVNVVNNLNLDGLISSSTNPSVEARAQAFQPVMNQLLSTLEGVAMPREEGSVMGDFPRMMRQMTENIFQNMNARFPDGVPPPTTEDPNAITDDMLEEAMRKELFPDEATAQDSLYSELTSASNIRLLEFYGIDDDGTLCFLLEEVTLEEQPEFAALSYVWGDPRPPLYQQNPLTNLRKHEVNCNGQKVLVSRNLHNALNTIFTKWEEDKSPVSGVEGGKIWIDQLCINQENIPEKSKQVAFMDTIYKTAKRVIAWIGPEDAHTSEAIRVLNHLKDIPREVYMAPDYDTAAELAEFSEPELLSLSSLFACAYFQRVWIVQEVVFAKEVWMLWGRSRVKFSDLIRVSSYLFHTGAWSILTVHAATFQMLSNAEGKEKDGPGPLVMQMGIRVQSHIRTHVKGGTSRSTPARILMMARDLQATDMRDKFYGMIGLAKEAARRLKVDISLPLPDYSKSLEAVTQEYIHEFVRQRKNADILTWVEDASYRKLRSLPSWVPDVSVPLLPREFDDQGYRAGGKRFRPIIQEDGSLLVKGRCITTVKGLATPLSEIQESKDWRSILELTLSLDSQDQSPPIPPDEQLVRALTCAPGSLVENLKTEFSDWLVQSINSPSQVTLNTPAFNATLLTSNQYLEDFLSLETSEARKLDYDKLSDARFSLYAKAAARKGMYHPMAPNSNHQDSGKIIKEAQDLLEALWKKHPRRLFPDPAYVREAIMTLRSRADDARPRQDEIDNNARKFRTVIGFNIETRVLFVTDDGYLGLGAQSTRVGDEIWVISGCKVPMILRRVDGATNQSYTVVGQCFVPHAMLGEFVDTDEKVNSLTAIKLI